MDLSSWAHSRDPKVTKAKALVERLPESPTKHGKEVPLPYKDPKEGYLNDFSSKEINGAIEKAPIKKIKIADLHAIQHSVKDYRVEEYLDHPHVIPKGARSPKHGGLVDYPIVIQHKGIKFLHDGHHRTTGAMAMGEKTIDARFVNFDAKGEK